MNNMFFVVCIVLIGCATAVIINYLEAKKKAGGDKHAEIDETLAQIDALEERVRVLERIVTENKIDLKQEIDRL